MTLDSKTLQEVIRVQSTEQFEQKKKIDTVQSDLEKIFDYKYSNLSRFNAKNFTGEVNQIIKIVDSFISENETQANNFLKESSRWIKAGEDANIHQNDPYLKAIREMRGALWNIFISLNYRDLTFEALIKTQNKLMNIVEATKDVELETQKLTSEKGIYDSVIKTLQEQMKAAEERSANREKMLMEQLLKISGVVQRVESKVQEIDTQMDTGVSITEPVHPEEELPEGQLSLLEKQIMGTMKSKKRMVEYISKRHPGWKNTTIAEILGVDTVYVAQCKPTSE